VLGRNAADVDALQGLALVQARAGRFDDARLGRERAQVAETEDRGAV